MAQKVTVVLEDDLDGGPADETVRFGFEVTDDQKRRQPRQDGPSRPSPARHRLPASATATAAPARRPADQPPAPDPPARVP